MGLDSQAQAQAQAQTPWLQSEIVIYAWKFIYHALFHFVGITQFKISSRAMRRVASLLFLFLLLFLFFAFIFALSDGAAGTEPNA